eukprot:9971718-Alexandrium_andersonii.AAC.1
MAKISLAPKRPWSVASSCVLASRVGTQRGDCNRAPRRAARSRANRRKARPPAAVAGCLAGR